MVSGSNAGDDRVVVVGTGAAGLSAALAASVHSAHVTVLESSDTIGGTTAMSGAVVWVPGSPWATAAGIEDSPEAGRQYLKSLAVGDADDVMTEAYVASAVSVLQQVEHHSDLRWQFVPFPDYHAEAAGGHPIGRGLEIEPVKVDHEVLATVRPDPYGVRQSTLNEASNGEPNPAELDRRDAEGIVTRGRGVIAGLLSALLRRGAVVHTGARANELIVDQGRVVGVRAGDDAHLGKVVLASGGFERNAALSRAFLRGPLLAPGSPPSNQGDALVMGMAVGAKLGNMSEAWWAPAMHVPGETLDGAPFFRILFTDCGQPGGVLVDARGRRFVDEAANYSDLGRGFHGFDAGSYNFTGEHSWLIFDARRRAGRDFAGDTVWTLDGAADSDGKPDGPVRDEPSWLRKADTIADLAGQISLDPEILEATIARFNADAAANRDRDFNRGDTVYDKFCGGDQLVPVDEAPFYALQVLPGALGTKGGLKTDSLGRVLRADRDEPIEGLFAAGNASANPFGCAYPGPGATVGPGMVFGWIAGLTAAGGEL